MARSRLNVEAHDIAAEIIRRAGGDANLGYVVHLSDQPTVQERLILAAFRPAGCVCFGGGVAEQLWPTAPVMAHFISPSKPLD